jgi:hypothetical protein
MYWKVTHTKRHRATKLSETKRKELEYITVLYPTLGSAYRLKEMFIDMFSIKESEEAIYYLKI